MHNHSVIVRRINMDRLTDRDNSAENYNREQKVIRTHYGFSRTSMISEMRRRELLSATADRLTIRNRNADKFAKELEKLLNKYTI